MANQTEIRWGLAELSRKCGGHERGTALCYLGKLIRISARTVGPAMVTVILLAGCSSSGSSASGSSGSASPSSAATGTGSTIAPNTPQGALLAAETKAQNVNSAIEMMSVQDSGAQNSSTVGTLQYRRKPTFLVAENLTVTAAGKSTQVKAIVTDTALYISEPSLASQIGKPWAKVDLSTVEATPALAALGQMVQSIQSNNFVDLTGLFASVSNVRAVGTATVEGVPATEYGGSFQAAALAKSLAPGLRKALAPGLQALGNSTVSFDIWVDGQGYPRKTTEVEHVNGETVSIALTITAINEPLQITLPPPSQTYTQPAG